MTSKQRCSAAEFLRAGTEEILSVLSDSDKAIKAGPLPQLRQGERQGDILSTQSEPEAFALVGDRVRDFDAEQKAAAAAAAERAESDRRQLPLL